MTYLEAFISEWQSSDYAGYSKYLKHRSTAEKEQALLIEKADALLLELEDTDMPDADRDILIGELKYKKIRAQHLIDLLDKRLAVMARAVGQQRNILYGGGELVSAGVAGDSFKVASFYDALLDRIHEGIHLPLFGEMKV